MSHPQDIDLATWPRRAAFEHFRDLAQPYYSVCVPLAAPALSERARARGVTAWLAYHHAALVAVNAESAFRQRIAGARVQEWDCIHASTTLLRADETFGFVTLAFDPDLARFARAARPRVDRVRQASGDLFAGDEPCADDAATVHMTTLPWLAFTSFNHARSAGDCVPKIAFGRMTQGRLPVAVDVHHALVDGLHVGRFIERLQAELDAV